MFQPSCSLGEDSPQKPQQLRPTTGRRGSALFSDNLVPQTNTTSETSDTKGGIDESAIDDDVEGWEDEPTKGNANRSFEDEILIARVNWTANRTANLPSGPSLLTLMVKEPGGQRSQSTSTLPRTLVVSPDDSDDAPPMRLINEVPCATARPINVTANNIQPALSTDATRRSMLNSELDQGLKSNLLRLRSQVKPFMNKEKDQNVSGWGRYCEPQIW